MSNFKSRGFKRLQAAWYKKLSKAGFADIERVGNNEMLLNRFDSYYFEAEYGIERFEKKRVYYERASHMLAHHLFQSEFERAVWTLHTEGIGQRMIAERLKCKRCQAEAVIKKIARLMGVG